MSVSSFYLTFGRRYELEEHPAFEQAHPDGWVRIVAVDLEAAREAAWMKFGENYAFLYAEGDFQPGSFPRGEIGVIREVMLPGGHLAWLLDKDLERVQAAIPTAEVDENITFVGTEAASARIAQLAATVAEFSEEDEPVEDVVRAFEEGEQGLTSKPLT